MTCTFFGHRNVPDGVGERLEAVLVDLIERRGVDLFLVGHHGGFDHMAERLLEKLTAAYPTVTALVVLSVLPAARPDAAAPGVRLPTVLPDGIEAVPPRYTIPFCNRWMIRRADVVVARIGDGVATGAARWVKEAEKKGKEIIRL